MRTCFLLNGWHLAGASLPRGGDRAVLLGLFHQETNTILKSWDFIIQSGYMVRRGQTCEFHDRGIVHSEKLPSSLCVENLLSSLAAH